jgi:glutathione synthase
MRSLFVMDPLDRINVRGDSTFVTMRECTDRGLPVWMCTPDGLYVRDGRARARAVAVRTTAAPPHFHVGEAVDLDLGDVDVVWMRKDPPFDMRYIFSTYLLDMAPPETLIVNAADGLKLFNEKMWVMARWPHLQPTTLLSNNAEQLRAFVEAQPDRAVLKPWDGNGGRGVLVTARGDRNLGSMIDILTNEGRDYVIAQRYLPEVVDGDKRILLFDGEPVGAMLRVPADRDHRANMHVGATVRATELSPRDREICGEIGPALKRWGMVFVGIDVIGGNLTEINVTSPTGIQEMNRLYGTRLEATLVDCVLSKLAVHRSTAKENR